MAQKTIEEQITDLEVEVVAFTNILLNQGGYKSIAGAGNDGAKTEYSDPIKIKALRQEARDRLAYLRLKQTQGYTV